MPSLGVLVGNEFPTDADDAGIKRRISDVARAGWGEDGVAFLRENDNDVNRAIRISRQSSPTFDVTGHASRRAVALVERLELSRVPLPYVISQRAPRERAEMGKRDRRKMQDETPILTGRGGCFLECGNLVPAFL
jgi:hypothetical protein